MSAFAAIRKDIQAPGRLVTLVPGDFCDEWRGKPRNDVVLGIRLLSASEDESARKVARDAEETGGLEGYNRALMQWIVARAFCDPNNVERPHPLFPDAEDSVPLALTIPALTRIFDEVERHHVESSSVFREADDDDVLHLCAVLEDEQILTSLDAIKQARVRRYLAFALAELSE